MQNTSADLEQYLVEAVKIHGRLCPGLLLGVRMSMLGLREIDIRDPKGTDRENILIFIETDICMTDGIHSVSGCNFEKGSMIPADFGKMAATFVNVNSGKAVKVMAPEELRLKALENSPDINDSRAALIWAYRNLPDAKVFTFSVVSTPVASGS